MKKLHKVCTALLSLTLMACTACTPVETNAPVENSLTGANIGVTAPVPPEPEETSEPEVVSSVEEENPFSEALSDIEDGTIAKVGDTVRINTWDTVMEYTVQNVQIFDHYTESGIPESEFDFGLSDLPFILLEVKVKKVSGPEWTDEDHKDLITNLCLYNRRKAGKISSLFLKSVISTAIPAPLEKNRGITGWIPAKNPSSKSAGAYTNR